MTNPGKPPASGKPTVEEILQQIDGPVQKVKSTSKTSSDVSVEEILQVGKYAKATPPKENVPTSIALKPVGQKDTHEEPVRLVTASGRYRLAEKVSRPVHKFDGGFIAMYGRRDPIPSDYIAAAKWKAMLAGAEQSCGPVFGKANPKCNYEDLTDATAAYRHFWDGKGKDRYVVNYEKYLISEPTAKGLIDKLVADFVTHVEVIGHNRTKFLVIGDKYFVGSGGLAEYPETVNWRRTIGAHILWVSAPVTVSVKNNRIVFVAEITIHMEDKYNFNPYDKDLNDGHEDAENGRFEMIGWANAYMNYASVARRVTWTAGDGKNRTIEKLPVPPPDILRSAVWD